MRSRDLAVGEALGDELEDAALLVGEAREPLVLLGRRAQPLEHPGGDRGVEQRLARRDPADGVDEVGAPDLLEHVARRRRP